MDPIARREAEGRVRGVLATISVAYPLGTQAHLGQGASRDCRETKAPSHPGQAPPPLGLYSVEWCACCGVSSEGSSSSEVVAVTP